MEAIGDIEIGCWAPICVWWVRDIVRDHHSLGMRHRTTLCLNLWLLNVSSLNWCLSTLFAEANNQYDNKYDTYHSCYNTSDNASHINLAGVVTSSQAEAAVLGAWASVIVVPALILVVWGRWVIWTGPVGVATRGRTGFVSTNRANAHPENNYILKFLFHIKRIILRRCLKLLLIKFDKKRNIVEAEL